jgi:hypothetical protein
LAQFVLWYDSRKDARTKVGKHKWQPTHRTLADMLGITEEKRRGGWDGSELTDAGKLYQKAVMKATREGKPPPDIKQWIAAYHAGEISEE